MITIFINKNEINNFTNDGTQYDSSIITKVVYTGIVALWDRNSVLTDNEVGEKT
jgi:hypothetical protein